MAAAGMKSDVLPVMSFSIGEQEAQAMGPALVEGSYAGWNYFQTVDNPENKKFVETYKAKFGADAVVTDPMVHGYIDVYIWKAAVEKAQSFEPAKVRAAAVTLDAIPTPLGAVKLAAKNSPVQTGHTAPAAPTGDNKRDGT